MTKPTPPVALTIAGSDSGGGAGIQADLKTFLSLGVHGTSAITAVTAQNTLGVQAVYALPAEIVIEQVRSVASDMTIRSVKTGMLYNTDIIDAVVALIKDGLISPPIVDPVFASASGDSLLDPGALTAIRDRLLPLCELLTPNIPEAALLTGNTIETVDQMTTAANSLAAMGARHVLLKGGHLPGSVDAIDILSDGTSAIQIASPRINTVNIHGTGCTLSAAIASFRARGFSLENSVTSAKQFVTRAISEAANWGIGHGSGPLAF